jgi:uncharacterized protein (TIGR00251 family)
MTLWLRELAAAVEIKVKVVPGSSKDRIVGSHGDACKVQVSAVAEGGRANARLAEVLAAALDLPVRAVTIVAGQHHPLKTVRIAGITKEQLRARLSLS